MKLTHRYSVTQRKRDSLSLTTNTDVTGDHAFTCPLHTQIRKGVLTYRAIN